jgi:hypothetical protein
MEIFKVQKSIVTTKEHAQVLIYNEDRSIMGQFNLTDEVDKLFNEDEYKIFVYGEVVEGELIVNTHDRAPWQDW